MGEDAACKEKLNFKKLKGMQPAGRPDLVTVEAKVLPVTVPFSHTMPALIVQYRSIMKKASFNIETAL